jgi:hypothetical protein
VTAAFYDHLFETFSDATVYFVMAGVGTVLFLLRLVLMLIGLDGDHDFDSDMAESGVLAHGGEFSLFSMLSILSFMMGAGWLGLAMRLEWGVGPVVTALTASAFGFFLMLLSSAGIWQMKKFNEPGRYDVKEAIGRIGQVYLRIPARRSGRGQVRITVSGRQKILAAITEDERPIESFTDVRAVGVQEDETLIVERT